MAAKSRRQERRSGECWLRASGFQQRRSWGGKALCAWVPSIKYPTPLGLCDWNCGQNVNMEPRRAAAPHQSHRPEAPRLDSVGDSVVTAGSTAKEQGVSWLEGTFNRGHALWRVPRKSLAKYRWRQSSWSSNHDAGMARRQRRLKHALAEV